MNTQEGAPAIHVNSCGEFDRGCACGSTDFYTVSKQGGAWIEVEPLAMWDGWACSKCGTIYSDAGHVIDSGASVVWLVSRS